MGSEKITGEIMRTDHLRLDRVKKEIVLASPEALAEAGGLRTDRKILWRGTPAARVEPGKGGLVVAPARRDLRPFDQFVVPVYAPPGRTSRRRR